MKLIPFVLLISFSAEASLFEMAPRLAEHVLARAQTEGKCVSVSIVDAGGHLAYFRKHDCAHIGSAKTSLQKAISANAYRKPTSDFVTAVKAGRHGILKAEDLFAVEGGLPLNSRGAHLGGIGVGGATSLEDEAYAVSALQALKE